MKKPSLIFLAVAASAFIYFLWSDDISSVRIGGPPTPDTLVRDGYDEKEMENAIARARRETNAFLEVLESKNADSFSVKAPIKDSNGTEHFWITDIRYDNGFFIGLIGNDPGVVQNVSFGQEWKIRREEITDWMFVREDRIYGGYTIDPLLPGWERSKADDLRRKLVR